jgi:DNA-directed RNA polymerase specialized sigma24 family protein
VRGQDRRNKTLALTPGWEGRDGPRPSVSADRLHRVSPELRQLVEEQDPRGVGVFGHVARVPNDVRAHFRVRAASRTPRHSSVPNHSRSRIPPRGFLSLMGDPIRLVGGSEPSVAEFAELGTSFEGFVVENQTRLFGSLCLMTGSRHEAEEIAQEAFVRVLERWQQVRALDDPTGYLFVTALNVFRKRFRRARVALRRSIGVAPNQDAFGAVEDREGRPGRAGKASAGTAIGARCDGAARLLLRGSRTDARRSVFDDPSASYEGTHRPSRPDR